MMDLIKASMAWAPDWDKVELDRLVYATTT
jgi:hypothetical protein